MPVWSITDIIDTVHTAEDAIASKPIRSGELDLAYHLHTTIGEDALGVTRQQFSDIASHIRVSLSSDITAVQIPSPDLVITAAVLLGVPGSQLQEMKNDLRGRVCIEVSAAHERASQLIDSMHHLLFMATTIRPQSREDLGSVPTLPSAVIGYRVARERLDRAQADLYDSVRSAESGGATQAEITRVTGLSKQRISQIVRS